MAAAVQLSTLGLWASLYGLCRSVTRRDVWIPARRTLPFVIEGAHAKGTFGHGHRARVAFMLGYAAAVPDFRRTRLLRVQRCCQGIDLALEFGNAAVGFLLAFSCWRCGDASAPGLCASLARNVWSVLVAAHLSRVNWFGTQE
jgi:hypothetical protein